MITLKELIDELGGVRSISLGSIVVCACYVAADRYVESVEKRLESLGRHVEELRLQERETSVMARSRAEEDSSLERRVSRLETQMDAMK